MSEKEMDTSLVHFGIPIHYDPTAAFMASVMQLPERFPGSRIDMHVGDSHPDRARNSIVDKFLDSERQWLFFLDADLRFSPDDMLKLWQRDLPVICGFYARKQIGPAAWVANRLNDNTRDDGLYELREAGTGCMCIHRSVIEAIIAAHPECQYSRDPLGDKLQHAVFRSGVRWDPLVCRRRWLSEDWWFCWDVAECGFQIFGDPNTILLHEGRAFFPIPENAEAPKE